MKATSKCANFSCKMFMDDTCKVVLPTILTFTGTYGQQSPRTTRVTVPPPFCRSIPKKDNQGHQKHTRNISQSRFKTNTALESKKLPCSTDIGVAIKNAWLYTSTPPHVLKVWCSPFGISVDKFALGHIFSGYFLFPLPTTITSMFHTYIPVHIHSPPIRIPTASLLIH